MLRIGVKGHAGMSPRRNFGRGGKSKNGPYKNKNNTPHGEKNSRKTFKWWKNSPHKEKNVVKGPSNSKKKQSSRKALKFTRRKRPPIRRQT